MADWLYVGQTTTFVQHWVVTRVRLFKHCSYSDVIWQKDVSWMEFRKGISVQWRRIYSVVCFVFFRELLQPCNEPVVYTVPSIGALALRLRSSCVTKHTQHTTGSNRKRTRQRAEIMIEITTGLERWNKHRHTCVQHTHRKNKTHTTQNEGHPTASIIKWGPQFVWAANYGLGPYRIFHGCGLGKRTVVHGGRKTSRKISLSSKQPINSTASLMSE